MSTYVVLANFTQQGAQTIKEGPARLDAAKQALQALGGELKGWYLTLGRYDVVYIFEAPDDATAVLPNGAPARDANPLFLWRMSPAVRTHVPADALRAALFQNCRLARWL